MTAVMVLEKGGRGGWVMGLWKRTVERGKKRGHYVVSFPSPDPRGGLFQGRRRKRAVPVHPDRVRICEDGKHSRACSCGC